MRTVFKRCTAIILSILLVYLMVPVSSFASITGSVSYTTTVNKVVVFDAEDFNDVCNDKYSVDLDYVSFTLPDSSEGVLYYDYSSSGDNTKVTDSTKYHYDSSRYLSKVAFMPKKDFSGTVTITYTAYNKDGDDYTGKVKITVDAASSASNYVTYTTAKNTAVRFDAEDFNKVCNDATDADLDYIKFTLPDSTYGVLYYSYSSSSSSNTAATASTKYYYNSSRYLSKITFVPKTGYTGTVNISYSGYNEDGDGFTGKVKIVVNASSSSVSSGYVTYSAGTNESVDFVAKDFNDVCNDKTDGDLDYINFTIPSASYGVLYYDYDSSSDSNTEVTESTKYHYDSSRYLSKITFVPKKDYSGTVSISYTGYNEDGDDYTSAVKINFGISSNAVSYTVKANGSVDFDKADFNDVCNEETDADLSYVKFTLPSSTYGVLYYDYSPSSDVNTNVSASTKYKYSGSPDLSYVTFVPKQNYKGTVSISYTGYSEDGDEYKSTVTIKIGAGSTITSESITYTTAENKSFMFDGDDFNDVCKEETGVDLYYIEFALPSTDYCVLYNSIVKVTSPLDCYLNSSPKISSIRLKPADDYTGTFSLSYTAYTKDKDSYTGTVQVTVTAATTTTPTTTTPTTTTSTGSSYFTDVTSSYSWAAASIDALYKAGYITGDSSKKFNPGAKITRGDFILMLYRALSLKSTSATTNFTDVPKDSYYYTAISAAKALGIAKGTNGRFNPKGTLTREDAVVLVNRALTASGTVLTAGSKSDLSAYKDSSSISTYAYNSFATLVKAGIIDGTASKINPKNTVTRAEMAVIVYRAIK